MSEHLAAREAERVEREAKGEPAPGRRRDPPPSKADPGLAMPRKHGGELERGRPEIVERIQIYRGQTPGWMQFLVSIVLLLSRK